jgi:two-component system response regulator CpxR
MRSVLIVDDDVLLSEMLREYLARHEIALTIRHNGRDGLQEAGSRAYDLLLLDVMLPDIDGFEVLSRLRRSSDLCVLLLTARGDATDRVRGLRLGADDYLPKPFDVDELVARISAILRRGPARSAAAVTPMKPRLQRGNLTIDFASRTVLYGSETLDLTELELSLLEMFVRSPGVVLTREELAERVFQRPFHPLDRSLDMYVSRLRRKLRSANPLGDHIKTIRSSGYLFAAFDSYSTLH